MAFVDPKTYVYKFIFDENDRNDTNIIQYFIMDGLVLCIKLNSFVSYIFYSWSLSNNIAVPISINKKGKTFL